MSLRITADVWDSGLSGNDLLVLLRIADAVGDDHRCSWLAVDTIARHGGMDRATAYRSLSRLKEQGYIEDVIEGEWPEDARKYTSVVRRVCPTDQWPRINSSHDATSCYDEPPAVSTRRTMRPNTTTTTTTSTSASQKTSSSSLTAVTGGVTTRPGHVSSGWPKPKRESARQRAARLQAEEDASDPFKVLGADPEPEIADLRLAIDLGDPVTPPRRRKRSVGPSEALSLAFEAAAQSAGWSDVPGAMNIHALAAQFAAWQRTGTSRAQIQSMIEAYWDPTFQRSSSKPAWQDFLAKRGSLVAKTAREATAASIEEDRYDDSKW
jgi:DNA-binding transcriptional ArsR family regulator